jgi:predicted DNA-binding protein YlxM (UPF0122 family)
VEAMKITIKQYAENEGISVQSVYAQIKHGSLKSVEENGTKYVVIEKEAVKPKVENTLKGAFKIIKRLQKENKQLQADLRACSKGKDKVFKSYLKQYQKALTPPKQDDVVNVAPVKKKRKKKK